MFTLACLVMLFFSCGQQPGNTTKVPNTQVPNLQQYIVSMQNRYTGWNTSRVSRKAFSDSLCKNFYKDITDSSLLVGVLFKLLKVEPQKTGGILGEFWCDYMYMKESIATILVVHANCSDALALSLSSGTAYYFKSFSILNYKSYQSAYISGNGMDKCDLGPLTIELKDIQKAP